MSQPSLTIGYVVAQLLVFPIGRAWEKLPRWRVPLGTLTFDVNPGKFTIKEHALIVIVSNFCDILNTDTTDRLLVRQPQYERCLCYGFLGGYYKSSILEQGLRCRILFFVPPDHTDAWVIHRFRSKSFALLTLCTDSDLLALRGGGWSTLAHSSGPQHLPPQFFSVLCTNHKTVHLPTVG